MTVAQDSKIEWCKATFNPWEGCTKVSPGCANCYAETRSNRLKTSKWGPSGTRVVRSESYWREPVKWNKSAACSCGEGFRGTHSPYCPQADRPRAFCASLADVFEDWRGPMTLSNGTTATIQIPGFAERPMLMSDARVRLLQLICDTPNLDWLLLTKRPQNIQPMLRDAWMQLDSARDPDPRNSRPFVIPPNIWLGTSVENQAAADERIPHLLRTPAAVRFLSCEPLLGPVRLDAVMGTHQDGTPFTAERPAPCSRPHTFDARFRGLHWVIVGGESGHGARPCRVEWVRSLVEQCKTAGVACFVKQLGSNATAGYYDEFREEWESGRGNDWPAALDWNYRDGQPPLTARVALPLAKKGGLLEDMPADLRVREFPEVRS